MLIAYWGEARHDILLEKIVSRIGEVDKGQAGTALWIRLAWYPVLILQYSAGISALASKNYGALKSILTAPIEGRDASGTGLKAAIARVSFEMGDTIEAFKVLSGNDRHFVPLSEYLFNALRDTISANLDLGRRYEALFDRYEVIAALTAAEMFYRTRQSTICLFGRFAWKHQRNISPLTVLIQEAEHFGDEWPPLKAGLFNGSLATFKSIAGLVEARINSVSFI